MRLEPANRSYNLRLMREPDKLTPDVLELLASFGPVSVRRMFSGSGLFLNGLMFGLIVRGELYLKTGDTNRAAFQAAGEAPFTYETKNGTNTITSFWRCPPELLDDAETFQSWARQAFAAATAAARAKPKPPRKQPRAP